MEHSKPVSLRRLFFFEVFFRPTTKDGAGDLPVSQNTSPLLYTSSRKARRSASEPGKPYDPLRPTMPKPMRGISGPFLPSGRAGSLGKDDMICSWYYSLQGKSRTQNFFLNSAWMEEKPRTGGVRVGFFVDDSNARSVGPSLYIWQVFGLYGGRDFLIAIFDLC